MPLFRRFCPVALALPLLAAPALAQDSTSSTSNTPDVNAKGYYATLGAGASWPQNLNGSTSVFGVDVRARARPRSPTAT